MAVLEVFGIAGLILLIGFLGDYLFRKTGIPDILILFIMGALVGPILKIVDVSSLASMAPLLSSLALTVLLFDGGLNLRLREVIAQSPRAVALSIVGVALSIVVTWYFATLFLEWSSLQGALLGCIVGGSSSAIVIPFAKRLKVNSRVTTVLSLESAFSDGLTIVLGIFLIQVLTGTSAGYEIYSVSNSIAGSFSIGAVLGGLFGLAWLKVMRFLRGEMYDDILTLCMVLLLYVGSESVGGNGAISALLFGLILGNGKEISRMLQLKESVEASEIMRKFQSQISFVFRTFFYAYIGMLLFVDNMIFLGYGAVLAFLLVGARFLSVLIVSAGDRDLGANRPILTAMLPRGLAAAILSQLPAINGLPDAGVYSVLTISIIIFSVVICSIGVYYPRSTTATASNSNTAKVVP